jgi:hypothetical protein
VKVLASMAIQTRPEARIELWQGDLTDLGPAFAVDALLFSAFPDDYSETPGSLVGALGARGLHVRDLALDKDLDIRPTHSCWLSKPVPPTTSGMRFRRLIGFEPWSLGQPPDRVGDIFRALEWLTAVRPEIRSAAMPVVAAGDAGYPVTTMLEPMLAVARPWMEIGLGLDRIAIAVHSDQDAAAAMQLFERVREGYTSPVAPVTEGLDFDVFVSYAHKDAELAAGFVECLREIQPDVRAFVDRDLLEIGMAWQEEIFESLERSRLVVALLSPDYLLSKPCKQEFGIARLQGDRLGRRVLCPVYVRSADLPTRVLYLQYVDAREGERERLRTAAAEIAGLLA